MRAFILVAAMSITANTTAQNTTTSNIIEGGKTLVELVRVFKTPRTAMGQQNIIEKKDSCAIKDVSDLCVKNSTARPLVVSLYRRNGNGYDANVLTMKVLPKAYEYLFALKSGIYKFKIQLEGDDEELTVYREGEMKINACENVFKEIKND